MKCKLPRPGFLTSLPSSFLTMATITLHKFPIIAQIDWVGFYGISTIVSHLIPNPLYTLNVYDS